MKTRYCPVRGVGTRYCAVRGVGTRYCLVRGVGTRHCLVRGVGTRYCLAHGAGTRYCLVRGVGTRDEALRTSAWEVIPRVIRLFSTFAVRFSDFVTIKKLTCGKSMGKVKVKPKTSAGVSCLCHPKSNRRVSKLSWPTTLEKYYRTYLQACMNIFRRVTLRSERTDAHLLSLLVKVIFFVCVFMCFFDVFSGKLHSITPHTLYFFFVSSFEIVFSNVEILKQFSSGALPPQIIFFSSLTSLELTRKRTMFGKNGI